MKTITAHIARREGFLRTTDTEVTVRLTGELTACGRAIGIVDSSSPDWAGKEVKVCAEFVNANGSPLIHWHTGRRTAP